ncbi:MAG: hypothetical protein K9L68_15045, partial [Spirochaetales bacterium]|nr:hypothetical protein [Spirochaetales bacterium]MCF7939908.1 hypothetical protein [Spirochaetales bacterium]
MIVKMNKLTVIILDSERRQALEELGSLGVMHLEEIQGEGETYQQLLEQQEEIENVLLAVPDPEEKPKKKKKDEPAATASSAPKDTESLVTYITELIEERKKINETIDKNRRALEYARHWGDFDEENFKELRDSGVSFTFFRAPRDTMERLKEKGFILPVQEDRKQIRGVIVTSSSESIDLSEEEDVQLLD